MIIKLPEPSTCVGKSKIAILAGTRIQFEEYLRSKGKSNDFTYVYFDGYKNRGTSFETFYCIGTFWSRNDAHHLFNLALFQSRSAYLDLNHLIHES